MNLKYFLIVSIFFTFYNSSSFAEKTHGIAMHGKPKYEESVEFLSSMQKATPIHPAQADRTDGGDLAKKSQS